MNDPGGLQLDTKAYGKITSGTHYTESQIYRKVCFLRPRERQEDNFHIKTSKNNLETNKVAKQNTFVNGCLLETYGVN